MSSKLMNSWNRLDFSSAKGLMGKPYTSLIEENESSEYDGGTSGQFNPHRQIQNR
jgi:hypothetical protein